MTNGTAFLDTFESAAAAAQAAETRYRTESVQRIAQLEKDRAFAFRRLNLLKGIEGAIREAEGEEAAVAQGLAFLRDRLNWSKLDETRSEALARFEPVVAAVFHAARQGDGGPGAPGSVADTLGDFEIWYADHRPSPFWVLFEQELPELPLVEV